LFAAGDLTWKADSPEQMFSLMYSTGFRLTGNHQAAALLVRKALGKYDNNGSPAPAEAVKSICRAFLVDTANCPGQPESGTVDISRVQKALLNLEPGERTAVILRDNLGFSYAEIAGVAMASEKDVAAIIAAARYKLKSRLTKKAGGYER